MPNPLLVAAYAFSVKKKSDKLTEQAISAEKSKTKIRNFIKGPGGIKYLAPNSTIPEGYSLYGYTVGNSGTMNKFDKEIEPNIDLYEHPVNKGQLITKGQFNSLNKGYGSIDQADSTSTMKYTIGPIAAQKSPADNNLNYFNWFSKRLENMTSVKKNVTYKYSRFDGKKFTTVPTLEEATHSQEVITEGDKTITKPPKKIDVTVKEPPQIYEYYNKKGKVTTSPSEIVSQRPYKIIDGKKEFVGKIEEYAPKAGDKTEITYLYDKDGERTSNVEKAVQQQKMTFNADGDIIKEGDLKEVKISKKTDTKLRLRVQAVNNSRDIKMVSQEEAFKLVKDGTHIITGQQVGEGGEMKEYKSSVAQKNDLESVKRNKDISFSISYNTDERDVNNNLIPKTYTAFVKQIGTDNLTNLNTFINENPKFIELINTNKDFENKFRPFIIAQLKAHFLGASRDIANNITYSQEMPSSPKSAYAKMLQDFIEFKKFKLGEDYAAIAVDLADENINEQMIKKFKENSANKNAEPLIIKKPVVNNQTNKEIGQAAIVTGYPDKYKELVKTLSGLITKVRSGSDQQQVNGLIAELISYEADDNGTLKKTPDGNLIIAENQLSFDFLNQLRTTSIPNKKIDGRQATFLDAFLAMIHPFPDDHRYGTINLKVEKDIKDKFASLVEGDFLKARNIITAFTSRNSGAVKRLIKDLYPDLSLKDVKLDSRAKSESAYDAITTIDSMVATYITRDGRTIDLNTKQGEVVVTGYGIYKTGAKVLNFFKGDKPLDIVVTEANTLANSLVDQSEVYESINPDDEKEIAAKKRNQEAFQNVKNIINGVGDINTLIKKLPVPVQKKIGGGDQELAKEVIRKLAVRQYHKYMLAYQLAAAIQGGTGGRTISDQDVENIMRALNFGFFTPPQTELATLQAARDMMEDLYHYHTGVKSTNPAIQFASIKTRQLLFNTKRDKLFLNVEARRNYITKVMQNKGGGAGSTTGADKSKTDTKEADRLRKFIKD